jgi:hypothetical protein
MWRKCTYYLFHLAYVRVGSIAVQPATNAQAQRISLQAESHRESFIWGHALHIYGTMPHRTSTPKFSELSFSPKTFTMFYLLLALLSLVVYCEATIPKILFTYQSQRIPFPTWFDYITLCLAPLVAHVAGGVVSPTLLPTSTPPPSWSARLPHFNPISIIWRYYVIGDRRFRARSWDQADMAACNAVFWDSERKRWDGSKETMVKSRAWITKMPETAHVASFSASSVTSLVLTAQGFDATFLIIAGLIPGSSYKLTARLAGVFAPLGCMGFMRLPAALWLSSDYGFMNYGSSNPAPSVENTLDKVVSDNVLQVHVSDQLYDMTIQDRLLPSHHWKGVLYRAFWLITVGGIGTAAADCTHLWWNYPPSVPYQSTTGLIFNSMYFVLTIGSISIHTFYVVTGKATSTVIPCIHATWYKIFTLVFIVAAFVCAVVAALETRIRQNGIVTPLPEFLCGKEGSLCIPVGLGQGNYNV